MSLQHARQRPAHNHANTPPECDRSFTRSDALAKHMRTVHETEALRPSDPVPKHHSSNPQNKAQRLRLTLKGLAPANGTPGANDPASAAAASAPAASAPRSASHPASPGAGAPAGPDADYDHHNVTYERAGAHGEWARLFPADVRFSAAELGLAPRRLLALLSAQAGWAAAEGEELRAAVDALERLRDREWRHKELLVENVMEGEFAGAERASGVHGSVRERMLKDAEFARRLDIPDEERLWWRQANGTGEKAREGL